MDKKCSVKDKIMRSDFMDKNERAALYEVKGYLMGTVDNEGGYRSDEVVKYAEEVLQYLNKILEGEEENSK